MAIPKLKAIIEQVYRDGDFDLTTLNGCGTFTRACAGPVHEADPRIVMLKKSAGRTHVVDSKGRRHAADALLFLEHGKGTSIDIIRSSRTPQATPAWTVDVKVRYTDADGFVPDYSTEPDDQPADPPPTDLEARVSALEADMRTVKSWAGSFQK